MTDLYGMRTEFLQDYKLEVAGSMHLTSLQYRYMESFQVVDVHNMFKTKLHDRFLVICIRDSCKITSWKFVGSMHLTSLQHCCIVESFQVVDVHSMFTQNYMTGLYGMLTGFLQDYDVEACRRHAYLTSLQHCCIF